MLLLSCRAYVMLNILYDQNQHGMQMKLILNNWYTSLGIDKGHQGAQRMMGW